MRLSAVTLAAAGVLVTVSTLSAGSAVAGTPAWGRAIEVPGTAALNTDSNAQVLSVSCPSSGNCGASGIYEDSIGLQGFVVNQTAGTWGQAIEVPGLAALNAGGAALPWSVSCASPGNCTAGGFYQDSAHHQQAFVVTQTAGTWGQAIEVPGLEALNSGGLAFLYSVSCASPGNCTAVGSYRDGSGQPRPFAVTQTADTWGQAAELPGVGAQDLYGVSVSCTAPGTCTAAGGSYTVAGTAFTATERDGHWSGVRPIPGLAALNAGDEAAAFSVSCPSAGNCGIAGFYLAGPRSQQGFLDSEHDGTWSQAEQVPGLAAIGGNGLFSTALTISCASAGNCIAGGSYTYNKGFTQAFAVMQSGGVWGNAAIIPGLPGLNKGNAEVDSVSCASKLDCAIGGYYSAGKSTATARPFVAAQTGGVLRSAHEVPGIPALNTGGQASEVNSVSCARGGTCALGGYYSSTNKTGNAQAFVDSQG
jgi:hypothetical protein